MQNVLKHVYDRKVLFETYYYTYKINSQVIIDLKNQNVECYHLYHYLRNYSE